MNLHDKRILLSINLKQISSKASLNSCLKVYQNFLVLLFWTLLFFALCEGNQLMASTKKININGNQCQAAEGSECLISTKEAFKLFKPLLQKNFIKSSKAIKLIDDQEFCEKGAVVFPQSSAFFSSCSLILMVKHNKKKHKMFCTLEYNLNQGSLNLKLCSFEDDESNVLLESILVE
ncbi:hypothetical protein N9N67_12130, partial [Bacteriovoracaceae bacterium]|nr:hypothetical protein [Bacteriovoracaceae bacterium]